MNTLKIIKQAFSAALVWIITLHPAVAIGNSGNHILDFEDAKHLVQRTGIGASPEEISRVIGLGRKKAIESIINGFRTLPLSSLPEWSTSGAPHHWRFVTMNSGERQAFRRVRLNEINSLRTWWVREMISSSSPQSERLVLFWHNHFTSAYSALNNQSLSIARQHLLIREHAAGNFRAMLKSMIRDPAMLNYLDNNDSNKRHPNENLARELMELFTLGEGSYSENDVKNAARALTGYSYSSIYDMRFVFKYWNHDEGEKTIFGESGNFDGDDLVDLILEQPAVARYIAMKFWREFIGEIEIPDDRLTPHAAIFRDSNYDVRRLYRSLLNSDDFWHADNRASLVKSPVSLVVGTIRSTGRLPSDWETLTSKLSQMGQHLFDPPNVAGWPGGGSWITPGRLLTRIEWLEKFVSHPAENISIQPMPMMSNSVQVMTDDSQPVMSEPVVNMMENHLALRVAAEEFDEAARYRVKLFSQDVVVWDSGEIKLEGGHDTKRMGRADIRQLPWQTVLFPVNLVAESISSIEVSFLNDGSAPGGAERNLFVSRASLGGRTWLAVDGEQTGSCARGNKRQPGYLYCSATLRMTESVDIAGRAGVPPASQTLRVSHANLSSVKIPKQRQTSEVVFTLSDVEFNNRYWQTINLRYLETKHGYSIRVNDKDCWPQCFMEWPVECKQVNKGGNRAVSLRLEAEKGQCAYDNLSQSDQQLVNAFWMLLRDFYAAGEQSPKLVQPKNARNYAEWQSRVDEIDHLVRDTAYYDRSVKLEIVPKKITDTTITERYRAPTVAGLTREQRLESISRLKEDADISLVDLLLPGIQIGSTTDSDDELTRVVTDLAFQLM